MAEHHADTGTARCRRGLVPEPPTLSRTALFLDLDGTLVDIAETPDQVRQPQGLGELLLSLQQAAGGAVAVVSGRCLADVDEILKPLALPGAGIYGAEIRLQPNGAIARQEAPALSGLAEGLRNRFGGDDRIVVEDKGLAVALHFRLAPEREQECRQALELLAPCPPLRLLEGKFAVEAALDEYDKGAAVGRLMSAAPFSNRIPIYIGDDLADEAAFAVVAAHGGLAIKVGDGPSIAAHRLIDAQDVRSWLADAIRHGAKRNMSRRWDDRP